MRRCCTGTDTPAWEAFHRAHRIPEFDVQKLLRTDYVEARLDGSGLAHPRFAMPPEPWNAAMLPEQDFVIASRTP